MIEQQQIMQAVQQRQADTRRVLGSFDFRSEASTQKHRQMKSDLDQQDARKSLKLFSPEVSKAPSQFPSSISKPGAHSPQQQPNIKVLSEGRPLTQNVGSRKLKHSYHHHAKGESKLPEQAATEHRKAPTLKDKDATKSLTSPLKPVSFT